MKPIESIFDMFIKLMEIIFGVNFPPVMAYLIFVIFFVAVFGAIFYLLKLIFGWCN